MESKKINDEIAKVLPEIYNDLAKPATQEIGKVAGKSAKALLSPIRGCLWGWEKIEKIVIDGVNKRLEKVPNEQQKTPEPEIAVPIMEALRYTAQNETLREMYLNLLANSMDNSKEKDVHPSFVEIIKQMNSLDAKVFDKLNDDEGYLKIINPTIKLKDKNKFFVGATPEWFIGWTIEAYNYFDISSSLIRLNKFGLVDLMFDRTAGSDGYDILKSNEYLIDLLKEYKKNNSQIKLEIGGTDSILSVNDYGKQFKIACT